MFYFCIFSNKLDLFEATCSILPGIGALSDELPILIKLHLSILRMVIGNFVNANPDFYRDCDENPCTAIKICDETLYTLAEAWTLKFICSSIS